MSSNVPLDHAWLGLAWHPDGKRFYVSGAGNNTVHEMHFEDGTVTRGVDLVLGRPMDKPAWAPNRPEPVPQSFIGGVAVSPDGARLYAVHVLGQAVSEVDLKSGRVLRTIDLPAEPYTCAVSPDGTTLFVSLWGGAKVLLFDAQTLDADRARSPSASTPTRWRSPGTASGSSSPARTRTRCGPSTWTAAARSSRSASRSFPTRRPDRRRTT